MSGLLAHGTDVINVSPDSYLGSPMYAIAGIHIPALVGVGAVVAWFAIQRRRARRRPDAVSPWLARYDRLDLDERAAVWLVGAAGVAHLALVPTHLDSFYALLFLAGGLAQTWMARRYLLERAWSRWLRWVLVGSLLGYVISSASGEAPDQVGLLVKLAELGALALVARPATRFARVRHTAAYLSLAVIVAAGAWAGAFLSGDGGHHFGETPPPGVLLPPGEDRDPTPEELARADELHEAVAAALAPFEDPAVAAAAGYRVDGLAGTDFHADNPAFQGDDHILEPDKPETLVYAVGASGAPVLLGAMFQMDGIGDVGPAIAGPLLVWHAHDHICLTAVPPFLSGLTGPYGTCPLGSVTLPITQEMVHVWTLPGVPDRFGDLDDGWLKAYLATR